MHLRQVCASVKGGVGNRLGSNRMRTLVSAAFLLLEKIGGSEFWLVRIRLEAVIEFGYAFNRKVDGGRRPDWSLVQDWKQAFCNEKNYKAMCCAHLIGQISDNNKSSMSLFQQLLKDNR